MTRYEVVEIVEDLIEQIKKVTPKIIGFVHTDKEILEIHTSEDLTDVEITSIEKILGKRLRKV